MMTKLQGIPKEYYEYVYTIEDETVNGMKQVLRNVLDLDMEILMDKGQQAREFIINEKLNTIQAQKIMKFIDRLND